MASFYGGLNGQSFTIKKIFSNYVALLEDEAKGEASSIKVSDYVLISYGKPGEEEYNNNLNIDLQYNGKNYNSSLWQKQFDGNIKYVNISYLAGATPLIGVEETKVVDANIQPSVDIDVSSPDTPKLTFSLPRAVQFFSQEGTSVPANAHQEDLILDSSTGNLYRYENNALTKIANLEPELLKLSAAASSLNAYDATGNSTIPTIMVNTTDTEWVLNLGLPRVPTISAEVIETLAPEQSADVSTVLANNTASLKFKIPRGKQGLKGDQGDGIFFAARYSVTQELTAAEMGSYIEEQYGSENIKSNYVFTIVQIIDNSTINYWCYKINGQWDRVELAGGTGDLLENSYVQSNDAKGYTIDYINSLIQDSSAAEGAYQTYSADKINDKFNNINTNIQTINTTMGSLVKDEADLESTDKTYSANQLNLKFNQVDTKIAEAKLSWLSFNDLVKNGG